MGCNISIVYIQADQYKHLGEYPVMSIAQGGCGIPFLAPVVYEYISSGKLPTKMELSFDDIPCAHLKFAIQKV